MATITPSVAGGNWSANAAWTGGTPPTAADDVVFHAGAGNITVDGTSGSPSLCRSLDLATFLYAGTLTMGATAVLNIGDSGGGSYTMYSGATFAPNASSVINFISTTSGNQLKFGGKTAPLMVFNGAGGVWQFQDAPLTGGGLTITLTAGSLDTNSVAVNGFQFLRSGTATAVLTLGTTTWTVPGGAGSARSFDASSSTGLTVSAASSTIVITNSSTTNSFKGGGFAWGTVTLKGTVNITGANTIGTLQSLAANATTVTLSANQTVTNFTSSAPSLTSRNYLSSVTRGTPFTITCSGTVTITNTDIEDITGGGAASWDISAAGNANGDGGGNSGITFAATRNCYLKTAVSVNFSASNWFTTSGGSTACTPAIPMLQDTAILDLNSVTAGGKTITLNVTRFGSINCTGVLNSPVLGFAGSSTNQQCYGDFILDSGGMTTTSGKVLTFFGLRGSHNINTAGVTITAATAFDCLTGTYTLLNDLTNNNAGNDSNLTSGTVSASSYNFSVGRNATAAAGTFSFKSLTTGSLTISGSGLTLGTGASSCTSMSITAGSLTTGSGALAGTSTFSVSAGASCTIGAGGTSGFTTMSNSGTFLSAAGLVSCSSTFTCTAASSSTTIGSGGLTCATFNGSSNSTRTISINGPITLNGTGTVWSIALTTGLTFSANNSTIYVTDTSVTGKTVTTGALTYNNFDVAGAASNGTVTFVSAFTANTFTAHPDASLIMTKNTTYTATTWAIGGSSGHKTTFATNTAATSATLSSPVSQSFDYANLKDMAASGEIPFYAGANSTDNTGNTNIIFGAPAKNSLYYRQMIAQNGSAF